VSKSSQKILIVEDRAIQQARLGTLLNETKYEVILIPDGLDALLYLSDCTSTISLILLDIHMPGLDVFGFLELIRSNHFLKYIPVILQTGASDAEIQKGIALGADAWIQKPYTRADLLSAINELEPKMLAYERAMNQ
jgi:CheY-like chemotaxis protein